MIAKWDTIMKERIEIIDYWNSCNFRWCGFRDVITGIFEKTAKIKGESNWIRENKQILWTNRWCVVSFVGSNPLHEIKCIGWYCSTTLRRASWFKMLAIAALLVVHVGIVGKFQPKQNFKSFNISLLFRRAPCWQLSFPAFNPKRITIWNSRGSRPLTIECESRTEHNAMK